MSTIKYNNQTLIDLMNYLRTNSTEVFQDDLLFTNIIQTEKVNSYKLYKEIIQQKGYEDLLGNIFMQWYTANKIMLNFHRHTSDISYVDTNLLLESFGYPYGKYHSQLERQRLGLNINNYFARKGEPQMLVELLRSFNLDNIHLCEVWLNKTFTNDDLYFSMRVIARSGDLYVPDEKINDFKIDFNEVVDADPLWNTGGYTKEDILQRSNDPSQLINLPSMTPYIALGVGSEWIRGRMGWAYINRQVRNEWLTYLYNDPHKSTPGPSDPHYPPVDFNPDKPQQNLQYGDPMEVTPVGNLNRQIYIPGYDNYISLFELVITLSYLYNEVFERNPIATIPNDFKHFELQLGDEYLDDVEMYIDEYNSCFSRPKRKIRYGS